MQLADALAELYLRAATQLPRDVEAALREAAKREDGVAKASLEMILENIKIAREEGRPICQDTGTPIFYVERPAAMSERELRAAILEATRRATKEIPLRSNSVDSLGGKNSGNNIHSGVPIIHFKEGERLRFQLLLKGGGSENSGGTYTLPNELGGRDLKGAAACVLDLVRKAQGKGCPPGILGVCIGSPKELVVQNSLRQFLRPLNERNAVPELQKFEDSLTAEINSTGIGPMGFGGKTTVLGVRACALSRHPASYFVDISYSCWALRRAGLEFGDGGAKFD